MPNLALMKLSTFYKSKGYDVTFIDLSSFEIDSWFGSKIFTGGSGINLEQDLPDEIEILTPDYEKFKLNYSIGFTSRGCIRKCDFCIVKEKEGMIKEVNMDWIKHSKVILLDNNFLASPKWREKLEYFIDNKIKVCFTQANDIRLINKENAEILLKVMSYDRKFSKKSYYFAFDDIKLEIVIREKIDLMKSIGFNPKSFMFYILCGFNSSHEDDYRRFQIIKNYGCVPYIMRFNNKKSAIWLNHFSRYINRKYYEFIPFETYNNGVLINKKLEPEKLIHECSKLNTEKDVNLLDQYLGE